MMFTGFDPAIGDKGRKGVGGDPVFPAVPFAHEFCRSKRNGAMAGGKALRATVGSSFIDRILQDVGCSKSQGGRLGKLEGAPGVPVAYSQLLLSVTEEVLHCAAAF